MHKRCTYTQQSEAPTEKPVPLAVTALHKEAYNCHVWLLTDDWPDVYEHSICEWDEDYINKPAVSGEKLNDHGVLQYCCNYGHGTVYYCTKCTNVMNLVCVYDKNLSVTREHVPPIPLIRGVDVCRNRIEAYFRVTCPCQSLLLQEQDLV